MDPRIREQAEVLVDHSTRIERGDMVSIRGSPAAEDLIVAVAELCGERGAVVSTSMTSSRAGRAYRRAVDEDDIALNEMVEAMYEQTDVHISIRAAENVNETSDVPPEKTMAMGAANKPIQSLVMDSRWVGTQHPAPGNAQKAEMSNEGYAEFVYDAINKDWDAQREHQDQLVQILDGADEVHIVSGDTTDVTMSIAGNVVKNDYGEHNMPGGEVFTAPVADSVEGEVLFDKPVMAHGREVLDARLVFEEGKVVEHDASKNEEVLTTMLDSDEGARYLGELGIGMNRDIDTFTYNMLFDEKMGDTVHMAIGMAYEDTVGEENERNDSAVHTDMIVDMSEDSFIEVDGERIQEDGTFVFEE